MARAYRTEDDGDVAAEIADLGTPLDEHRVTAFGSYGFCGSGINDAQRVRRPSSTRKAA